MMVPQDGDIYKVLVREEKKIELMLLRDNNPTLHPTQSHPGPPPAAALHWRTGESNSALGKEKKNEKEKKHEKEKKRICCITHFYHYKKRLFKNKKTYIRPGKFEVTV